MMSRSFLRVSMLTLPLFLAACGEGWEAQKTTQYLPYGNERTAGSGVVYVRAQLLPEKDLKLEPELKNVEDVPPAPVEPVEEVKPALDAEEIFTEAQTKSKSSKVMKPKDEHSSHHRDTHEKHAVLENTAPLLAKEERIASAHSIDVREHVPLGSPADSIAVDLLQEEPAAGSDESLPQHVRENRTLDFDSGLLESELSPEAGDVLDEVVTIEVHSDDIAERTLMQPIKEIVAPKKDTTSILSVGQETLNEIYNNRF